MKEQSTKQIERFDGEVLSHKTQKTAIVKVSSFKVHPKYHKRYVVTKKYMAHDEANEYSPGDRVEITPCKPMSKRKRFVITRKIS